jgi:hypothetical protein
MGLIRLEIITREARQLGKLGPIDWGPGSWRLAGREGRAGIIALHPGQLGKRLVDTRETVAG